MIFLDGIPRGAVCFRICLIGFLQSAPQDLWCTVYSSVFIYSSEILGLSKERDVRLVLEEDGSEVRDEAVFLTGSIFLLGEKDECWRCRECIDFDSGTYPLVTDFPSSKSDH